MNETSVDVIDAAGLESRSVGLCHNDVKDVVNAQSQAAAVPPAYKKQGWGGRYIFIVSTTVKGKPRTLGWAKGLLSKQGCDA